MNHNGGRGVLTVEMSDETGTASASGKDTKFIAFSVAVLKIVTRSFESESIS